MAYYLIQSRLHPLIRLPTRLNYHALAPDSKIALHVLPKTPHSPASHSVSKPLTPVTPKIDKQATPYYSCGHLRSIFCIHHQSQHQSALQ